MLFLIVTVNQRVGISVPSAKRLNLYDFLFFFFLGGGRLNLRK